MGVEGLVAESVGAGADLLGADLLGLAAEDIRHDLMPETDAEERFARGAGLGEEGAQGLHPGGVVVDAFLGAGEDVAVEILHRGQGRAAGDVDHGEPGLGERAGGPAGQQVAEAGLVGLVFGQPDAEVEDGEPHRGTTGDQRREGVRRAAAPGWRGALPL